jgi:hypothetical protein
MLRLSCLVIAVVMTGCRSPSPRDRAYEVSGTVTFDGQPVPEGGITFKSDDKTLADDYAPIQNGVFKCLCSAGKKRVEIRGIREVPQPNDGVLRDPKFVEFIPAKYNTKTELTVEISIDDKNEFVFDLKSDK